MKKQGRLITVLILALIIVVFAILNVEPVAINFGFTHVKWPLIIVILVSLLIGAIITFLAATGSSLSQRKAQKEMAKEVTDLRDQQATAIKTAVEAEKVKHQKAVDKLLAEKEAQIHELHAKINQITQTSDHHNA
ncbi:LapA family protein [Latilactobacillus graminis]|uniref:Lipopolysaccharide assembly protein A domain-containing protein n=2 Tax=Latilactobacillus graminis TaxID=60519 RepID=A0AA89KXW4_9LACO|nr:LapA family protein [Latilactobacillus graminis]KRM23809.1 hypothetical protein FC90_GL001329 [Latilactobacillus graminis DSM 20719]QFP79700.1 LapA family protein [Latilactobacillus graminis]